MERRTIFFMVMGIILSSILAITAGLYCFVIPKTIGDSYTVYQPNTLNRITYNDDGSVMKRLTIPECKHTMNKRWVNTTSIIKPLEEDTKTNARKERSVVENSLATYYICIDDKTIIGELEDGSEVHIKYHGSAMEIMKELYKKHADEIDSEKYDLLMGYGSKDIVVSNEGVYGNIIGSLKNMVKTVTNGELEVDDRKILMFKQLKGLFANKDNNEKNKQRGIAKVIHVGVSMNNIKIPKIKIKTKLVKRNHHGHTHARFKRVRHHKKINQEE